MRWPTGSIDTTDCGIDACASYGYGRDIATTHTGAVTHPVWHAIGFAVFATQCCADCYTHVVPDNSHTISDDCSRLLVDTTLDHSDSGSNSRHPCTNTHSQQDSDVRAVFVAVGCADDRAVGATDHSISLQHTPAVILTDSSADGRVDYVRFVQQRAAQRASTSAWASAGALAAASPQRGGHGSRDP